MWCHLGSKNHVFLWFHEGFVKITVMCVYTYVYIYIYIHDSNVGDGDDGDDVDDGSVYSPKSLK